MPTRDWDQEYYERKFKHWFRGEISPLLFIGRGAWGGGISLAAGDAKFVWGGKKPAKNARR